MEDKIPKGLEGDDTNINVHNYNNLSNMVLDDILVGHQNYLKIPLTKTSSGLLLITTHVNKCVGKFILDTGANTTVLEEKSKQKFQLQIEPTHKTATGAGGTGLAIQFSGGNTLEIGQLVIEDFTICLMNLDHVNRAFGCMGLESIDGVIGADILNAKEGIVDYSNHALYLRK